MNSDWDDAPDYIRNNKKQSPWRTVVILGAGSAITWGLIALFAKPIVIDVNQLKQAIRIGGQPVFSEQPAQTYSEPRTPSKRPLRISSPPHRLPSHRLTKLILNGQSSKPR